MLQSGRQELTFGMHAFLFSARDRGFPVLQWQLHSYPSYESRIYEWIHGFCFGGISCDGYNARRRKIWRGRMYCSSLTLHRGSASCRDETASTEMGKDEGLEDMPSKGILERGGRLAHKIDCDIMDRVYLQGSTMNPAREQS